MISKFWFKAQAATIGPIVTSQLGDLCIHQISPKNSSINVHPTCQASTEERWERYHQTSRYDEIEMNRDLYRVNVGDELQNPKLTCPPLRV